MSTDDPYTDTTTDDPYSDTSADGGTSTQTETPNTDVDGPAAKKHGDYFYDVHEYATALTYYQEALDKGDISGDDLSSLYFNMGQCHHKLNDPASAYDYFYNAIRTGTRNATSVAALQLFFWAATGGENPPGSA